MNLSKFFIDRPIFAGVLSLLIFLGGLIAVRGLPISEYPESCRRRSSCARNYPGANPQVIAETVATPIEESINGVEGMLYMSSQATTDGLMTLTVTFKLGTDPDKAQQLVQNRVSQAEPRLPEEVRAAGRHHDQELARPDDGGAPAVAERPLRHDLPAQLRGAQRQGPPRARRRAWATCSCSARATTRCASGSIRRRSPSAACRRATSSPRSAARTCRPRPASSAPRPTCTASTCSCRSTRRAACRTRRSSATSSSRPSADGAVTRLRDVARIELGAADYSLRSLLDNKDAVADPDLRGARAPTRSRSPTACAPTMAELQKAMPEGVEYEIVYDPTQFVRASIESVVHTLLEAIALVVLVVILFLQTWRASIIPLLAVPVAVVGTFAVHAACSASRSTR